ncbi:MAG TPA: methyltransferase [Streptomyces sp.]|nr:methyltransferase [Streptomyces sp.]HZF91515.1 methyltransferase [Streptomyces sp.]
MTMPEPGAARRPGALEDPYDVMLVGWSFLRSRLLTAASELGVFTALAERPLDGAELSARLGLHPRAARDFLDALAAIGLLTRTDGRYGNSPAAARHLLPDRDGFVGGFLRMTSELMGNDPQALTGLLRTGNARGQNTAGEVPFTRIFRDPERLRLFLSAMDSFSTAIADGLAACLDWARYRTFSDIGGARGNLAARLAAAHPSLTGTVLDRPAMKAHFEDLVAERGVGDRLDFVGGNFFVDDLPPADVVILGSVLHDWPDERRLELLRRAHAAVLDGGCLVVYDTMLDDDRSRPESLLLSLVMMTQSAQAGGFSPAQCREWVTRAGFTVQRTVSLPALTTAVVARKN